MRIKKSIEKKVCMIVLNDFTHDSRVLREAKTLAEENYQVFVIALHEEGLKQKEIIDNIQVIRIPLRTRKLSKARVVQLMKYIEFVIKSLNWLWRMRPAVCHCHDLNALPVGYLVKKTLKAYLIYDSHELESHRSTIEKEPRWFRWLTRKLESFLMKKVDKMIVVSDGIADYLVKQDKIKRPVVIRNIPNLEKLVNDKKNENEHFGFSKDYKIIIYQGALFLNRGIEELIESMNFLNKEIILIILGNGPLRGKLENIIKKNKLENRITFKGCITQECLFKKTSQADMGIAPIKDITLSYYFALPNKFFEYIIAGLPVAVSDLPEMRKIVKKYQIGGIFNPDSPQDIARIINTILENNDHYQIFKQNVLKAREALNWEKEKQKLINLYRSFNGERKK